MSKQPKTEPEMAPSPVSPAEGCSDLDIDRLDLAARLLASKQPVPEPDLLLERAASQLAARASGRPGEVTVLGVIAALIRTSAEAPADESAARDQAAALRFTGLLAAPLDPATLSALRGLLRRGELERALPLPAQRQIRRLCRGTLVEGDPAVELGGLAASAWESLLELLARSLMLEPEAEIRVDMALECPDEDSLRRRRAAVRATLDRGTRRPSAPPRALDLGEVMNDDTVTTAELGAGPQPEREPLAAGHKIGRFTLLTRLGVGAMGVVYSAYDPELDRRIAVKLLRAPEGRHTAWAQARLLREAQAMARVNHPNVAVVHDVGTQDRDVFVAMEFIRGHTLQAWQALRPRKWAEILEVYVQAGRGLAAAHGAGLVHRDFKPSNAMIGDDGRVRVLDFGLCHAESVDAPADGSMTESGSSNRLRVSIGEDMVGTPAYMAPEQFQGRGVGVASDQFSFCAALYEALYEQLPFAGETVHQLAYAVARNELRAPPRGSRVPVWLHAVIVRGMRPDPGARFPTMDALLRALDRGRARVRSGVLAAAAGLLVAGSVGFWTASTRTHDDPCSGGAASIAEVWGRPQADAAERAFTAAGPAVAAEIWPRVEADLELYADQWQAMHRASCEASQRGEHSQEMLDRRMACLAERRTAMAEATRVLMEADLAVARRALAVVGELPAISRCGDLAALSAVVPVSADPQVRAAVEVQRSRLARVRSLEQGGRRAGATELAQDVLQAAERLADRSLLAEALLQRAYLDIHGAASTPEQDTRLTRAYLTALGGGLDELVAEALALRLYARGRTAGGAGRALEDLAVAREAVTRLASPGRLRGLVLNNGGAVYMGIGEAGQAEPMFREALAAREAALGPEHVEVAFTLVNLAMVSGVEAERIGLMQRALGIFDEALGPAHPQTIDVRVAASLHARDPVAARGLLAPACDALARYAPDDRSDRARCLGYLAHHAAEAGDEAASTVMLLEVADLLQAPRPRTVDDADVMLLRGRAALASRGHVRAIEELRETLANPRNDRDWWQQRHGAELRLLLGLHLIQLGYSSEANTALREAVEGYEKASATTRDIFLQQRLAFARLVLGRALLAGPEGAREGSALLDAAERWYAEAGPGYAWRLQEIQRARGPAVAP